MTINLVDTLCRLSPGVKNLLLLLVLNALVLAAYHLMWPDRAWLFVAVLIGSVLLAITGLYRGILRQNALLDKIEAGLMNMNDGNLAVTLPEEQGGKGKDVISLFNRVADRLRRERQHLYQRELLLDKVMNSTSMVTLLVDNRETIVFYNQAAQVFFEKRDLGGAHWPAIRPPGLAEELVGRSSVISSMHSREGRPELWSVSCSDLSLHGMPHQLYLFRPMTEELNRQELATWKKAIRVVSHELNNSIAPISSLCHSGTVLAENINEPRLDRVFTGIAGRVQHLNAFVKGYAQMAKLSTPQKTDVDLKELLGGLHALYPFTETYPPQALMVQADATQLEQLFINILNNAHQAAPGSPVTVTATLDEQRMRITVCDEGPGIDPALLNNVLLPFYSTKPNGSGMGLAICRDIIDAHGGELNLRNRAEGGLAVDVVFPL